MTHRVHNCLLVAALVGFGSSNTFGAGNAESNAAVVYERAFKLVEDGVNWQQRGWLADPESRDDPAAQDWLRRVDESVSLLHQAASMPYCKWTFVNESDCRETVNEALILSRVVTWGYDGRSPEPTTVVRDQMAMLALSRNIGREGVLLGKLVELALDATASRSLSQHLYKMSEDELVDLRSRLKSVPPRGDLEGIFDAEGSPLLLGSTREQAVAELAEMITGGGKVFPDDTSSFAYELRLPSIVKIGESSFQIGLEEKDSGVGYVLRTGQQKRGVKLLSVDLERGEALLMKDDQKALVRLKSRDVIPLWLAILQEDLACWLGEEVARKIRSEHDLSNELCAMYDSAQEELRLLATRKDFLYLNIPAREGEESSPFLTTNLVTELLLRPIRDIFRETAIHDTMLLMLDAGIDVSIHGEDALAHHGDPYGDGPFAFERTEQGFMLRSNIEKGGEKVVLRFGPPD